jgi:hypothetical protein
VSRIVPLNPVPSQTVSVTVGGQVARIAVRTIGSALYFTLDGVVTNRVCRDRQRLLVDAKYRGFAGDFAFVDTKGAADPAYWGLGDRWQLVYYNAGE